MLVYILEINVRPKESIIRQKMEGGKLLYV